VNELDLIRRLGTDLADSTREAQAKAEHLLRKRISERTSAPRSELWSRYGSARVSRRAWAIAIGALLLVGLLVAPPVGLGSRILDLVGGISGGNDVPTSRLSREDRWLLKHRGVFYWRSIRFLGAGGTTAYYLITRAGGSSCVAVGLLRNRPHIGSVDCQAPGAGAEFPSTKRPILDRSMYSVGSASRQWMLVLAGLAADGVARVGVVDAHGRLYSTPTVRHVYYLSDLPDGPLRAIVASDAYGRRIYTLPLQDSGNSGTTIRAAGEAGSVLIRFMNARIQRDNNAFESLLTSDLRKRVDEGALSVPTWQVSNPCWYRFEVLEPTRVTRSSITEHVRIYEHWWPGDVGGGPPKSFEQRVRLEKVDGDWLVGALGPATKTRAETGEPHGRTLSACALAQG
jgi:hypothetical protein